MNIPEELLYSKSHEWVKFEDDETAFVGITDYAQEELGDLVFVNLPEEGDEFATGEVFADVESVKAVSDINSPVTGTVAEVNEAIMDAPESINSDPYEAWFVKFSGISEQENLMDAAAYEKFVEEEKAKEE
ncbi:MAG: glycine cleavage system protein GcvH [Eubacteriaceae bacterium]|jgi:glycine cleavage system H protein|nr:glycine cleavage system protein GcvH [Eubacteriaceae bacterium]